MRTLNPNARALKLLVAASLCLSLSSLSFAATGSIKGSVLARGADGEPIYLPGAIVKIEAVKGDVSLSTETDRVGHFSFSDLPEGEYVLTVELAAFQKAVRTVTIAAGSVREENVELRIAISEQIVVQAESGSDALADRTESATKDKVTERTLDTAVTPMRNDRFTDVIPLLPGVVRGPDGLLNIKGARAAQSNLVVNSASVVDPVTGEFGINLPIDAVESVQVISNPYSAEHGRFSGAVMSVETKPGGDKFKVQFNSFIPRLRRRAGTIMGIESFTPRLRLSGPIIKDRLFFSQSFQYRFVRTRVPGLPDLQNDTALESFDSFTQLDYTLSPNHHLTATFSLFPQKNTFVNLNTFNPMEVTPNYKQRGFNFGLYERAIFSDGSLLESLFNLKRFDADILPQGERPMILAVDLNSGNFFNRQDRDTLRLQALEAYTFRRLEALGKHLIKVGFDLNYTDFNGSELNNTVKILRADGTLSQRIDFIGPGKLRRDDTEVSGFAQDKWEISSALILDLGLRFDHNTITGDGNLAPRAGFVLAPFSDRRTILKGGAGLFYDKVPLNVGVFDQFQRRVVTTFARDGATVLDGPRPFGHELLGRLKTPYSFTWNVEFNRELGRDLALRVNYLERSGKREFIVDPVIKPDGSGALVLQSAGSSKYRELQFTSRYQVGEEGELIFSYVRSKAEGDLNDFNQFFGNFRNPIIRPNEFSIQPFDSPNRFLAWGVLHLPGKLKLAPVLEIRDGFPYSLIDEDRNFVGTRNRAGRFPLFASLDLQASKELKLLKKYRTTIGVKIFNVTNHFNPRDVQNNLASASLGGFYNSVGRFFRGTFRIEY